MNWSSFCFLYMDIQLIQHHLLRIRKREAILFYTHLWTTFFPIKVQTQFSVKKDSDHLLWSGAIFLTISPVPHVPWVPPGLWWKTVNQIGLCCASNLLKRKHRIFQKYQTDWQLCNFWRTEACSFRGRNFITILPGWNLLILRGMLRKHELWW